MKKFCYTFLTGAFLALCLLTTACSNQTRTTGEQDDGSVVDELYAEMVGQVSGRGIDANVVEAMDSSSAKLYYVRDSLKRPVESVLSLIDAAFLSNIWAGYENLWTQDLGLAAVDVLFIDAYGSSDERYFTLMIKMHYDDGAGLQADYFGGASYANDFDFKDGVFETAIEGANGELVILRSKDIDPKHSKELATSAKLEIWVDSGGGLKRAGQVSTMRSYQ